VWKTDAIMLILASQSTTRKALLAQAGLGFSVHPPQIDERESQARALELGGGARDVALTLAREKALNVSTRLPDAFVIGADQTLALGDELLHKPPSLDLAKAQLDHLRGKTHRLHAGAVLAQNGAVIWSHLETAELTMREFSPEERDQVLAQEGPGVLASVGGYRLEGPSIKLFEAVTGDYFTILGLPLLPLLGALRLYAPHLLEGPVS
jgi:septum formation protein